MHMYMRQLTSSTFSAQLFSFDSVNGKDLEGEAEALNIFATIFNFWAGLANRIVGLCHIINTPFSLIGHICHHMATFPCSWANGRASGVFKGSSLHNEQRRRVRHYCVTISASPSASLSRQFRSFCSSPGRLQLPVDRSAWPLASTASSEAQQSIDSSDASDVRFATFNVLSSSLCSPQWYCACNPEDLDGDTRLDRVMNQLDAEITKEAVICLQEVAPLNFVHFLHSLHVSLAMNNQQQSSDGAL